MRKTIFPVTRIHEPLQVDVEIQAGRVVDAWVGGHLFRGFEAMMAGRDVRDAPLFLQRICGICSSAHAVAAAMAMQQACRVVPTPNGQHLINMILAADMVQNHLRHYSMLVLFDYVRGPDMAPWVPRGQADYRLPKKLNDDILAHARAGVGFAARAHEMLAVFGAKAPHQQTIMATGVTQRATADMILTYTAILREIKQYVSDTLLPDVLAIADYYKDYYAIGVGYGNLLSFGMFPAPVTGVRAVPDGVIVGRGAVQPVDGGQIRETVRYSWYRGDREETPAEAGPNEPAYGKQDAYSWVRAPRYNGLPCECGPLARAWIGGSWRRGVSVMDRIVARARETLLLCELAEGWAARLVPGAPTLRPFTPPPQGEGSGLTDVMRGTLGHWLKYKDGKIERYRVITPTEWNFSPRDALGRRGPVEEALVGTPVADAASLVEVGRVVRSFDPCFTCSVHVLDAPGAREI